MSIKIENVVLPSPQQWMAVVRGMRNPMNSWDKSDSYITHIEDSQTLQTAAFEFFMGEEDHKLAMKLAKAGKDHRKFMRMIPVFVDIVAPLYWWKEADTYKVGTVANSCSTMHTIHKKELSFDDFSCENMNMVSRDTLDYTIRELNVNRSQYNETKDRYYWDQIIQLLPSSYNQRRTLTLNYEVLSNMYHARKNHKLQEWRDLCAWIESLPYSELITGEREDIEE
jgi:Leucine-rich repeat (LRR) protein